MSGFITHTAINPLNSKIMLFNAIMSKWLGRSLALYLHICCRILAAWHWKTRIIAICASYILNMIINSSSSISLFDLCLCRRCTVALLVTWVVWLASPSLYPVFCYRSLNAQDINISVCMEYINLTWLKIWWNSTSLYNEKWCQIDPSTSLFQLVL